MIGKNSNENKNKDKNFSQYLSVTLFLTTFALGLPFSVLTAYFLAFQKRVYPKISLCETPLTGKNFQQVTSSVTDILQARLPEKILLISEKKTFFINPKIVNYLSAETVKKSLKQGRENFLLLNLPRLITFLKEGKNLTFDFELDSENFETEIASLSAQLYLPAIEPQIKIAKGFKEKRVLVETGKNGQELDLREFKARLTQSLACPQKEIVITLPINPISPAISEELAKAAQKRASFLLGKEIKLKLDNQTWTITEEELVSFISFNGGFDPFKIEDFSEKFTRTVNHPPENAAFRFEIETNRVLVFKPSKEGLALKQAEFAQTLENRLEQLEETIGDY